MTLFYHYAQNYQVSCFTNKALHVRCNANDMKEAKKLVAERRPGK